MPEPNKVIYKNTIIIDLTADTVTPADLRYGITAHASNGTIITGTRSDDLPNLDIRSY